MANLWIETREGSDGRPVLRLAGALCSGDLDLLERQCAAWLGGPTPLVLDLSRLTFLSSAGARLLNRLAASGVRLSAAPDLIAEVLADERQGSECPEMS